MEQEKPAVNRDLESRDIEYFDADRPVEGREQDRLGRRSFAEAIARHIRTVPAAHGFTIAVVGRVGIREDVTAQHGRGNACR